MLNKIIICAIIFLFFTSNGSAQTKEDYHKFEVYSGYSNNQDESDRVRLNSSGRITRLRDSYNGFEISGVGNFKSFIGFKGDLSAVFRNRDGINSSIYNFLGGIQFKNNNKEGTRFRPFAHALVGIAIQKSSIDSNILNSPICMQPGIICSASSTTRTGFAAALGGGIDVKATKRFSIRAFQIDYNPIHPDSNTQDNFRFGIGIVFH